MNEYRCHGGGAHAHSDRGEQNVEAVSGGSCYSSIFGTALSAAVQRCHGRGNVFVAFVTAWERNTLHQTRFSDGTSPRFLEWISCHQQSAEILTETNVTSILSLMRISTLPSVSQLGNEKGSMCSWTTKGQTWQRLVWVSYLLEGVPPRKTFQRIVGRTISAGSSKTSREGFCAAFSARRRRRAETIIAIPDTWGKAVNQTSRGKGKKGHEGRS